MTGPVRLSHRFRFLGRYWHTLRHLRPVQFYGRLWFRLYRPRPARPDRFSLAARNPGWTVEQSPFPLLRPVSMLGPARFRFLSQTHDAIGPEAWNDPARDKLWLYNLHYFDDLNAVEAPARADWHRALVQRWMSENPPGQGNGWEPYPTSLRIVNWVKWLLREEGSEGKRGTEAGRQEGNEQRGADVCLMPQCLRASLPSSNLATQAHWLQRRLERHLLGNHLFANAKALVFAGAFFVGPESERWLRLGQRLLRRELDEQILADGGHFERSPMYHAILLEDVLDILRLGQVYPDTLDAALLRLCEEKAIAMRDWLAAMTHPDGQISFFNDAAFGIAPTLAQLERYAQEVFSVIPAGKLESRPGTGNLASGAAASALPARSPSMALGPGFPAGTMDAIGHSGPSPRHSNQDAGIQAKDATSRSAPAMIRLRESGYIRLETGPVVALLDVAPIGPDYLPGHAHADTLSFELSLFGQRVIVNGGTSRYGTGPERLAERGTAAHSTVQIDGADSSEVWGGFRVARRTRPFDVMVRDAWSGRAEMAEMGTDHVFDDSELPRERGKRRKRKPGQTTFSPAPSFRPGSRNPLQGQQPRSRHITDAEHALLTDLPDLQGKPGLSPILISAAHDGYQRLPGKPVHRRQWQLGEDRLVVTDRIEGDCRSAIARFHLHPQVEASIEGTQGALRLTSGACIRWHVTGGHPSLAPDTWHPEFGCSLPSQCLEVVITGDQCALELTWTASGTASGT